MYQQTQNWSWLFYPPPYNFLAPSPGSGAEIAKSFAWPGLGCASCGGTCKSQGLGQSTIYGQGLFGSTLFQSPDPTTWGWGEWTVIGAGAVLSYVVIDGISKGARAAYAPIKRYRSRAKKKAQLQSELDSL